MKVKIYTDFSKRKNSTKVPSDTEGTEVTVKLKEGTSIYNPSFILSSGGVKPQIKYLKWDTRYYYVNDVVITTDNNYQISCSVDVLASHKESILNTSAFVKYSTSNYDTQIIDPRLSMSGDVEVTRNGAKLYDMDTSYNVLFVSSDPNYGGIGCISGDMYEVALLAGVCTSDGFLADVMGGTYRQLQGAYDCLLACYQMPFNTRTFTITTGVRLANWLWGGNHYQPQLEGYSFGVRVDIPWQFSDFRRTSRYCSVFLWLPFVGFVQVNTDDIRTYDKLTVIMNVSGINGVGSIEISETHTHYPCCVGAQVPIGTIKSGLMETAISSVSAVANMSVGNFIGGGINAFNAFAHSLEHNVGATSGGVGGYTAYALPFTTANPNYVYCYVLQHDTSEAPSNMATLYGRPLNNVVALKDLTGYVECEGASVQNTAPENIKEEINNYLNGGVYIE